jgi:undecaprenyl-diphosphatase
VLDRRLLRLARTCGHTPAAERLVARFSSLGEHGAIWLAIGACGWLSDADHRPAWRRATGRVGLVLALNTAIKLIVRRPRPQLEGLPALVATPTQLSFPSAHASTSFAGARSFARLGLPAAPAHALAAALSLSRLYLGVHNPTDVLAGGLLGAALASKPPR